MQLGICEGNSGRAKEKRVRYGLLVKAKTLIDPEKKIK